MKLLFDQNLSPRLVNLLADLYPGSSHVYLLSLDQADDKEVWNYAKREGYLVVTKDADFNDFSLLFGFPPNVVWIRRGNCRVADVEAMLRKHRNNIGALTEDNENGVIALF